MDPVSLASSFAAIVGLMANFAAERRSQEAATFQDFTEWLLRHHHEKTIELLEQNARTTTSIKALLNCHHEDLLERFNALDDVIARIASGYPEFRPMVESMKPDALISEQALSILDQISSSGAKGLIEERHLGSVVLHCTGPTRAHIAYTEPSYLDDDLATLVELRLLRLKRDGKDVRIFTFTREAERFMASIREATTLPGRELARAGTP